MNNIQKWHISDTCLYSTKAYLKVKVIWRLMSFNVKVISNLNDKNVHLFLMFLCSVLCRWYAFLLWNIFMTWGVKFTTIKLQFAQDILCHFSSSSMKFVDVAKFVAWIMTKYRHNHPIQRRSFSTYHRKCFTDPCVIFILYFYHVIMAQCAIRYELRCLWSSTGHKNLSNFAIDSLTRPSFRISLFPD